VDEPHSAIDGPAQGEIVNLTDRRAEPSRAAQLEVLASRPAWIMLKLQKASGKTSLQPDLPHLVMPAHHDVRSSDVFTRRLHGTLAAAAELGPSDFSELLLTPGVGARTVRSLAMVAEIVHGSPYRFQDPARCSLAHGGKDRHPYPVPLKVYDETIRVLKSGMQKAKLGPGETLDHQARLLERTARGPSFEARSWPKRERDRPPSTAAQRSGGRRIWRLAARPRRPDNCYLRSSPLTPPGASRYPVRRRLVVGMQLGFISAVAPGRHFIGGHAWRLLQLIDG
jgi:uncharacterized protein